ncbi:MAG: carboxymuconolactone decarboxylase family protein [Planctomycetota bacterium]|jgi:alkylhydroperoxidase family enzyme
MAAHSTVAAGKGMPEDVLDALRAGTPIADAKLEALRVFTEAMVRERGEVAGAPLQAFLEAGYAPAQALEVVTGVAMKTISNYVNHFAETPLDAPFAGRKWEKQGVAS